MKQSDNYRQPRTEELFPVIIELIRRHVNIDHFLASANEFLDTQIRTNTWWRADSLPNGAANPMARSGFMVCWISERGIKELDKPSNKESLGIKCILVGRSFGIQPLIRPYKRENSSTLSPSNIIESSRPHSEKLNVTVGIIDDGIAFAHKHFREFISTPKGDRWIPRIRWFWDQGQEGWAAKHSPEVPYGAEWIGAGSSPTVAGSLDDLFSACTHGDLIDEDEVYRHSGQSQVSRRARHGTHVLDLAAGCDNGESGNSILAVQLPTSIASNPGDPDVQWNILEGLAYIIWRANSSIDFTLSDRRPVVVNLSYGIYDGPHDGSLMLERAMDRLADAYRSTGPLVIVMAAGNHALVRLHSSIDSMASGDIHTLRWMIPPDSHRPAIMELWVNEPGSLSIELRDPLGRVQGSTIPSVNAISSIVADGFSGNLSKILISISQTASNYSLKNLAPSGVWTLNIKNISNKSITFDARIRRNDIPFGFTGQSRQSKFEDEDYIRFDQYGRELELDPKISDSPIKRSGTLNGFATGSSTVVVAAGRWTSFEGILPSPYSSQGTPCGRRPDLMGPGDRSSSRVGLLAAGTRSGGSKISLNGTSVAAPVVVRALASALSDPRIKDISSALTMIKAPYNFSPVIRTGGFRLNPFSCSPEDQFFFNSPPPGLLRNQEIALIARKKLIGVDMLSYRILLLTVAVLTVSCVTRPTSYGEHFEDLEFPKEFQKFIMNYYRNMTREATQLRFDEFSEPRRIWVG